MIPLSISISATSVDTWLQIVAWLTVASILAVLWILRSYLRYRATDADAKRQIRELRPQLLRGTPVTVRIKRGFDDGDVLERLRSGFDVDDSVDEDDATIVDVARGLSSAAASARPSWIPVLAWRGLLEGALVFLAGLVAFAPIAYWRAAVDPSLTLTADGAASAAGTIVSIALGGLAAFPHAELVWALLVSAGILGIRGVWGAWIVPSIVLVAGGIALSWLHTSIRQWDEVPDDVRLVRRRSRASLRLLAWALLVWIVGSGAAAPFALVDGAVDASITPVGEAIGLLLATIVAGVGLSRWISSTASRVRGIGEIHTARSGFVVGYLLFRRIYLASVLVVAGLVVGYVGYAVSTGRILEIAGVIASAPTWVVALLALGGISIGVIAALQIPDVLEDLRDLSSRISRSTALRLWLFARGIPVVGTVAAFSLVLAIFSSLLVAGGAAVATGLVLRIVGQVLVRVKYRALRRYSGWTRPVKEVHVDPYTVEDADGETIWVADVDGTRLAHKDREYLLEDVLEALRERTETGKWPTTSLSSVAVGALKTESEHYAERLDMGLVDVDRLRTTLLARSELETKVFLREHGGEIDDDLAREALYRDYPEWVVDDSVEELRRRGDVDRRNGNLVLIE